MNVGPIINQEETRTETAGGCPECLIDRSRRTVPVPHVNLAVFVDDEEVISQGLCREAGKKAFPISMIFHLEEGAGLIHTGHGQVGIIRQERLAQSPGSAAAGAPHHACFMVTAKHNLRAVVEEDDPDFGANISLVAVTPPGSMAYTPRFDVLNWEKQPENKIVLRETDVRQLEWVYGVDLAVSHKLIQKTPGYTNESKSFQLVRPDFEYEIGQRVAIAVLFDEAAAPTAKTASHDPEEPLEVTRDELDSIYGFPGRRNIYTGVIKLVGQSHIEYDINAFTGCSGAVVFLLDQDQPGSVQEQDYGKAIAVHAGCVPYQEDQNFGFKLTQAMLDASQGDPPVVDFEQWPDLHSVV